MQAELELLRSGRIGFGEFVRLTRTQWENYASMLLRRWRAPEGVEREDLVQEMLLRVWAVYQDWQPERGPTLAEFCRYSAIDKAKKWLHKQRNAYRRDDKSPGRFPMRYEQAVRSAEDGAAAESYLLSKLQTPEEEWQQSRLERLEDLSQLLTLLPDEADRYLLVALAKAGGSVELAGAEIFGDARTRLVFRLRSEGDARQVLRRMVERLAQVTEGRTAA